MIENGKKLLVICDGEKEYLNAFSEYLQGIQDFPWEVLIYTEPEKIDFDKLSDQIGLCLISEALYNETIKFDKNKTVILNESGLVKFLEVKNIDKFQRADEIYRDLLEYYAESLDSDFPKLKGEYKTKFIGIYTPVRRCLQTGFALSMGQILSKKHKTLYLNFERFCGIGELMPNTQTKDLADLLFFLNSQGNKFRTRMQTMIQKIGELEYISPMKSGENLLEVPKEEWLFLMDLIAKECEYEYVIMDLSECMQGLFDILRKCTRVYTIVKNEKKAEQKLDQYEQLLAVYKYQDVINKTTRCNIPLIKRLPPSIEEYSKGDLASYVEKQLEDLA